MKKKTVVLMLMCAVMELGTVMLPTTVNAASETAAIVSEVVDAVGGEYKLPVANGADISADIESAVKAGYSEVVIPAGNYTMRRQIQLESNMTIKAEGATIKATSGDGTILFTAADHAHTNLKIVGGTWDGNKKTNSAVFRMMNTTGFTLENCIIKGSAGSGLNLTKCKDVTISNTTLSNNAMYGVNVNASKVTFKDSAALDNKKTGFFAQDKSEMNLTFCRANGNTEKGVYFQDCSGKIKNCTVSNNKDEGVTCNTSKVTAVNLAAEGNTNQGLVCADKSDVTVSGATITRNHKHGVQVTGSSKLKMDNAADVLNVSRNNWSGVSVAKKSSLTITGGQFDNNGQSVKTTKEGELGHGIGVYEGSKAVITDITANNNKVCGLSPFGKNVAVSISNSNLSNNGRHGIGGRQNIDLTVKKCTINGNKLHGIMANDKSKMTISDTKANSNGKCGICVGESSKATIKKSTTSSNMQEGIYVYDKSNAKITNCVSASNKKCGITTNENADVKISDTVFEKNKMYGVNIKGGKADIQKCTIKKNKKSGVQIKKSDAGKKKEAAKVSNLSGNKVSANGEYGIYVNASTIDSMQKNTITDHTKCGIGLYKKSTAKKIKKNELSNTKGREVYVEPACKTNVAITPSVVIDKVKKNATKIKGSALKKAEITVTASKNNYTGKAGASGKFTVKTAKLAKGTTITVKAKDTGNNIYKNSIVIR